MKGLHELHGLHELGGWPEDLRRARRFWGDCGAVTDNTLNLGANGAVTATDTGRGKP